MKQYQPLYLKYRPQTLGELVGQDVVSKTLSNALEYNKIVHAYLFCGPRGTGKTSTARILAKSLNCEKGVSVNPCGKCTNCSGIMNGNSLDVIEIDAASHRKVEDAEDLTNRVNLGTYGARYKIYIIDEVHMLTDHAFNALLKTIEEPPKNVIFILATTEEYKVIPTIISRCQKLDFKPIYKDQLEQRIRSLAESEKINIDQTIVSFISKRSLGCLRDAISLLDQISVLQIDNKPIDPKEVFELFGSVDRAALYNLTEAILSFDQKKSIDLAESLVKSGKDISELFKGLLELIIDLSKAKIDSNFKESLSKELSSTLTTLDKVTQEHLLKIIQRLQDSQSKLRFAISQELQFMVEIMSMLDKDFLVSVTELNERVNRLEDPKNQRAKEPTNSQANETPAKSARSTEAETKREAHPEEQQAPSPKPQTPQNTEPQKNGTPKTVSEPIVLQDSGTTELDTLWRNIVGLIESNPTKTLLNQSESYLLNLSAQVIEIGLSKDMFLPRLEKDQKKQEMILKATKAASGIEPKAIRFKVQPNQRSGTKSQKSEVSTTEQPTTQQQHNTAEPPAHTVGEARSLRERQSNSVTEPQDDFTRAIGDLLGAKQIE